MGCSDKTLIMTHETEFMRQTTGQKLFLSFALHSQVTIQRTLSVLSDEGEQSRYMH